MAGITTMTTKSCSGEVQGQWKELGDDDEVLEDGGASSTGTGDRGTGIDGTRWPRRRTLRGGKGWRVSPWLTEWRGDGRNRGG